MKKNVMMRVASAMLVLTLLTTCVISGTFAKYTTKGEFQDSARVAKWGVTIEGSGTTFADAYKDQANDDAFASYPQVPNAGITVRSDTQNTKVVAPGTHGALAAISISGTPEVSVDITYAATLTLSNWSIPGATEGTTEKYCPIVITVNGKDYRVGTGDAPANTVYAADSDALVTAVNAAISDYSKSYAAGTNLADQSAENLAISWKWEIEGADGAYQTDAKDTALGNWSKNEMSAPTISLTVTATATQKD